MPLLGQSTTITPRGYLTEQILFFKVFLPPAHYRVNIICPSQSLTRLILLQRNALTKSTMSRFQASHFSCFRAWAVKFFPAQSTFIFHLRFPALSVAWLHPMLAFMSIAARTFLMIIAKWLHNVYIDNPDWIFRNTERISELPGKFQF